MKSFQKFYIMLTYKALSVNSFPRLNTIAVMKSVRNFKECVHSISTRPMSFGFLPQRGNIGIRTWTCSFRGCPLENPNDGYNLLNIEFRRPFSFVSSPFNSRILRLEQCPQDVGQRHYIATPAVSGQKYDGNEISTNYASQAQLDDNDKDEDDEDQDVEELKKQAVWDFGPTPAPTFNFAAYADESDIIRKLINLDVDLSKVELKYGILPFVLKLDYEKDVVPHIE